MFAYIFYNFPQDAGDRPAMAVKREGKLVTWNYTEYLRDITSVAKAFIHLGLEHHNGVAIWGFNSPEWFISDVAAIFAGGVVS
jgi:long-chain-fatty-acid--CoA ligase ACSBG